MDASAAGWLGPLFWLATSAAAPLAIAQPAPSAPASSGGGVELRYEAFAECPDSAAFAKNLGARRRGQAKGASPVRLEVRLRRLVAEGGGAELADRVEGSIIVTSAGTTPSARRIVAASCGEAADALALIAALVLQGIEVEELPASEPNEPTISKGSRRADKPRMREPGRDPERPSQDAGEASASAATEHAETSGASEASTEAAIEPEPEPATASRTEPEAPDASAREVSYEEGERERDSRPRALRIYALIAGGVAAGVLPRLQPLPELSLSLEQGEPGDVLWSAHAAFRISPDQTRHFDQGVVTFGWWTSLTALCAGARGAQLSASGCAAVEVGALSGAATGTQRPRDERRAWVALGPGLTLAWDVTPALRLQLRGELLTPLTRYSLELPGGTAVHEPGTLGLRAALGAGLRLP